MNLCDSDSGVYCNRQFILSSLSHSHLSNPNTLLIRYPSYFPHLIANATRIPLLRRHSNRSSRSLTHMPRRTTRNLHLTSLPPLTALTPRRIQRPIHLSLSTIILSPNTRVRSGCRISGCLRGQDIVTVRRGREDCGNGESVVDGEDGCEWHSWTCVAGAEVGDEGVVLGDGFGGGRGKGVGDADGELLVPGSGVFVAEEVEVVDVVCPGHGDVEFNTALLFVC